MTSRPRQAPSAPGPEDFTAGAVYKAVLLDTIQHPLTILPAALSGVGALYMALLGLNPTAFLVTLASALAAAGAWVYNYFVRGEDLARRHVSKLREQRREVRREEIRAVADGWQQTGHGEGIQQVEDLLAGYHNLDQLLRQRLDQGSGPGFTLERLRALAEDTFREGISILRQALDIHHAMGQVDRGKLERELADWREEQDKATAAARREALATRIAAHERRLSLLDSQAEKLEELLARCETLEGALESTGLEIVDLSNPETLFNRGSAADDLERAMNAARRAEERIQAQEKTPDDDDIYLRSGPTPN